jgi:polysaccharide biosynthesis protein PslJ
VSGLNSISLGRRGPRQIIAVAILVIAAGLLVGLLSAQSADVAIIAALLVLSIGLVFMDPVLVPVLALPATLMQGRLAGLLSISDLVLAVAALVVLMLIRPEGLRSMQPLLWAGTFYLATGLPSVVLNPFGANIVEWFHEVALVLGSMIVGYAVGRAGRAGVAARIYVLACVGIAIAAGLTALVQMAQGDFEAVFLPELNKNTIGGMLGFAIVLVYARPPWLRLSAPAMWTSIILCFAGTLAAQSRQALIGSLAGMLVLSLRRRPETGKVPKLIWVATIPVLVFVLTMLNDQIESGDQFNSAYVRLNWYAQTIQIWLTSPAFGVGQRWWYTNRFGAGFQPPNAEFEVLSAYGVVGLTGFLVMFAVAIWALWRINPVYGTVGVAIVVTRFVQAQFDLYWVAGQASLLWIVAGICYGTLRRDQVLGTEMILAPRLTPRRVFAPVVGTR